MKYVNNVFQLAKHITEHKKRLYILGMEWSKGSVSPFYLKFIIFFFHDIEKYFFLPWLWKYYGPKGDKIKARKLYDRMNKVGNFIISFLLFFFPVYKNDLKRMQRMEKIIDVVDRSCDPVAMEEFNLKKKRPLTDFLTVQDLPIANTFIKRWMERFSS